MVKSISCGHIPITSCRMGWKGKTAGRAAALPITTVPAGRKAPKRLLRIVFWIFPHIYPVWYIGLYSVRS